MKLDGCTALVTGGSAGLGEEFARQLAPRARVLVLVARRQERLEQVRAEFQQRYSQLEVHIRAVDLADASQLNQLAQSLEKIEIDFLVNNAGLGDYGSIATSDVERVDRMIDVNVRAVTLLTRFLLPRMIARKRGAILNVSSSAAFLPIPGMAIYAATKAYVNSFTEALRVELRGKGISVTALCPGPVSTEFGDVAARPGGKPETAPDFVYVSAADVVRESLLALEANRPLVIPGVLMKLGMLLVRITPMPVLRFVTRFRVNR